MSFCPNTLGIYSNYVVALSKKTPHRNDCNACFVHLLFERANLSAFITFVRFALVWFCLFPLPLGVLDGLRLVIVALSGPLPYFF